jgi:hypothetical protein
MRASQERRQHRPIRSFMPFVNSDLFVSRTEANDRLEAMPVKAPREHAMNCERVHDMRTFLFALLPLLASCADYQIKAAQPRAKPTLSTHLREPTLTALLLLTNDSASRATRTMRSADPTESSRGTLHI